MSEVDTHPEEILADPGDPGELLSDPKHIRSDASAVGRAARDGWDLNRGEKDRIKTKVIGTLEATGKPREVVRLAHALGEMDKADVEADKAVGESGVDKAPVNVQVVIGGKGQPSLGRGELLPGLPAPDAFAEEDDDG